MADTPIMAVARWWTAINHRGSRDIDAAWPPMLAALPHVDEPVRKAVNAWIAMHNRHINQGASVNGAWRERDQHRQAVTDALNTALDGDAA